MTRRAAIDIGTNTAKFLMVDEKGVLVAESVDICRLGQGSRHSGKLSDDAMERTLAILTGYMKTFAKHDAALVGAVATQAVRSASNGRDFERQATKILGQPLQVIDGDREAELIWLGIKDCVPSSANAVIIDVGGGSTEFIFSHGQKVSLRQSLPIGAVHLTESYVADIPTPMSQVTDLYNAIDQAMAELPLADANCVLATSGTATTLSAIHGEVDPYDRDKIHGVTLNEHWLDAQVAHLASLELATRKTVVGLHPGRADVIVAGAAILQRALAKTQASTMTICDRGVRWGLLAQ